MKLAVFGAAWLWLASAALAQGTSDARWNPWLGCWRVEADARAGLSRPSGQVCVTAEGSGVTITTTPDGGAPMAQRVTADTVARPVTDGSCSGTEQSEWSYDGFRLYSRAALTCGGAQRQVSGISILAPDGTWIEAQAIEIGARSNVRVRRFTKDGGAPATPARGRLTVAEVQDASRHVAAAALEAALVEARATFGLTRASLEALDDAGVPSSVIDVMVALTYPQAFAIHPASRADRLTAFPFEADPLDGTGLWWPGGPASFGGYFDSAYLLSPFGYSAFGAYPVFFGAGDDGGGGGNEPRPVNPGRVINRLGYTRLAPRGAESAGANTTGASGDQATTGGSTVTSRGYTRSDGGGSSAVSGSSGGGGGSASGGGSTSGGGGRTAVDR